MAGPAAEALDLAAEFAALTTSGESETTRPCGGVDVRLVRVAGGGEGRWDAHDDGPETVLVWSGAFKIELDAETLTLGPGGVCVITAGARHRGTSPDGAEVMLLRRSRG